MKSLSDRTPARFGDDQKTDRQSACICIGITSSKKTTRTKKSQLNHEHNIRQESNSLNDPLRMPLRVNTRTLGMVCMEHCLANKHSIGAAEIAHWPVTCDSVGSAATARSSQPGCSRGGFLGYFINLLIYDAR